MTSSGKELEEEKALLTRLKEGNYEAFEEVYGLYYRQLAGNLMKLLKNRDLVGEALQEIFMRLWNNRDNVDPEKPIKAYLFRIGENLVYDAFRRAARDEKMRAYFMAFTTEAYEHIEKTLYEQENRKMLYEAIDQLPPQRKKVYRLCKLEEKSYKEISEMLGISTAAVNDHVTKANAFLKEYFSSHPSLPALITATVILGNLS
ncbi:RNA polymerase sigma factor [Sphingobacterium detergens]|uniref:RNA polymerase sigma-70 factor (ECF subfamily) n=1 Tax=Sphingobacterium detergens TaxID=1145106 RepID=A0A420ARV9_SPHD1|nr:sigma-70 family RNA polymerase sigma factor [Sphingobacterium detergens]RKE47157.1 RNA polymerase sigma-70 factor (ECF subfamily) [Sphingobacterium detergens]